MDKVMISLDELLGTLGKDITTLNCRTLGEKNATRTLDRETNDHISLLLSTQFIQSIGMIFGTYKKHPLYFQSSETTWSLFGFHGKQCYINDLTSGRHLGYSSFHILFKFALQYFKVTIKQHFTIEIYKLV